MPNEEIIVNFPAEISAGNNCVCNACHHLGRVVKLKLPETLYRDGKSLTTEYADYWLCLNCREKLVHALIWGEENG